MDVVYLILLGLATVLLVVDSFSPGRDASKRGTAFSIRLLPFALALVVFVWFLQIAKAH